MSFSREEFEHLYGTAPYRILGSFRAEYQAAPGEQVQPGAACHCCGQALVCPIAVVSSDGIRTLWGPDCIQRINHFNADLLREAHSELLRQTRDRRHASEATRVAEVRALIERPDVRAILVRLPHPRSHWSSLLSWADWMLRSASASTTRVLRVGKVVSAAVRDALTEASPDQGEKP